MTATEQAREALSDAWAAFERATDASQHTDDERASARSEAFEALARADALLEPQAPAEAPLGDAAAESPSVEIQAALTAVFESLADERQRWASLAAHAGRAMQAADAGDRAETRRWLYEAIDLEHALTGDATAFESLINDLDPTGEHDPVHKRWPGEGAQ